ncbi:MAG: hypothetical protein IPP47_21315 [Bryobacterales bacterium]|nr:hypothetical protein [Bryobacterales bacterium]
MAIKEKAGITETPSSVAILPDPPKPKDGHLTVTCKPVDCVVLVDKKVIGSTKNGDFSGLTLPEGKITVSASSENYIPDKEGQIAEITDGGSVNVEFKFKLSPVALQARGIELFDKMVQALGGDVGLRESRLGARARISRERSWRNWRTHCDEFKINRFRESSTVFADLALR